MSFDYNKNRGRNRSEIPESVGSLLDEFLAKEGLASQVKEYAIVAKWPEIVDAEFAAATTCQKVEKGVLYVKVISSAWRQEAAYKKRAILTKIQKEHDGATIKDIVFV